MRILALWSQGPTDDPATVTLAVPVTAALVVTTLLADSDPESKLHALLTLDLTEPVVTLTAV